MNWLVPTILGLSAVCGILYGGIWTLKTPSALRTLIKTVPVAALAFYALIAGGPTLLVTALALGALGDAFLSRKGELAFVLGLGSFLLGHLAYCALLQGLGAELQTLFVEPSGFFAAVALLILGVIITRLIWPRLGQLKAPVVLYIGVIMVMGWLSLSLPDTIVLNLVLAGALMFIASDALLAIDLFVLDDGSAHRAWVARSLWFLYWGGQAVLTGSVILHLQGKLPLL